MASYAFRLNGRAVSAESWDQSGRIAVSRVVCAHDCGLVVNPDALKNQIEGCIVQTLSRALHEQVTFDRARVTSVDWASYPILRATESPAVDVILIDRRDQPLLGAGEAATAPVAAALANAVRRDRRSAQNGAVHARPRQSRHVALLNRLGSD
jgi:nicotinate dehydrogenase subunit B